MAKPHFSCRFPTSAKVALPLIFNRNVGVYSSVSILLRSVEVASAWPSHRSFSTKSQKTRAKALSSSSDEEDEVFDDEDDVVEVFYNDVFEPFIHKSGFSQLLQYTEMLNKEKAEGGNGSYFKEEDEQAMRLWVSMPGLGKEDVKISFEKDKLTMKGESATSDDGAKKYKYNKKVYISSEVFKVNEIKAEMKNGILKVMVPKIKEEEKKDVIRVFVN
ncbi:hypothetical protein ACHQM5_011318 [Ranunculus cassubicifolius]